MEDTGTLFVEYPSKEFLDFVKDKPKIIDKMENKYQVKELRVFGYKAGSFKGYLGNRATLKVIEGINDAPKYIFF